MKRKLTAGQTSVSLPIFVQATNSTTGGGLGSLTHSTAGLVAEYRRRGQSSWTAITLATKTLGTWASGGFVADGSLAGAYELDLPDAVCASGARWVAVRLYGAANMLPVLIEIELDVVDYLTARFGAAAAGDLMGLADNAITAAKFSANAIAAAAIASGALNDKGNWSKAGDQMSLTSTILTQLFADADVTDLVNQIAAKFDAVDDLPIATIASATRDAILNRVLAGNHDTTGTVGKVLQFLDVLISSRLASASYTAPTTPPTTTEIRNAILDRVLSGNHDTSGTVGKVLQFLDVLISSRLASASYTAPDNARIATIDALLAALTEVVSTVTRFRASALSQAPTGGGGPGGGLTTDQDTKLTEIHEAIYPDNPADPPLVITPSDPDHVTGWSVCYGLDGEAAAGIVVTYKLLTPPPRDAGKILNGSTTGSETSASNGLVQFEGLLPGATYSFTCGATTVTCTIPLDADPEAGYQLPSFVKT